MSVKYCDRAFLSMNGVQFADLQSGTLRQTKNARVVPSMTNDGFNRGYVQGNTDIDITAVIAVRNKLARAKLEATDFENNDVQVTWRAGAEQFVATGVFLKSAEDAAGGIGDEVKCTFEMGAVKLVDSVGNSSLFNLSL